jgi:uncharacterized DUF497 family protein
MHYEWSEEKNEILKKERGVSFEMVLEALADECLLADMPHPNREKYPHQSILVVRIEGYCYVVPYVEAGEKIFLKTIIPSRKMQKIFGER